MDEKTHPSYILVPGDAGRTAAELENTFGETGASTLIFTDLEFSATLVGRMPASLAARSERGTTI